MKGVKGQTVFPSQLDWSIEEGCTLIQLPASVINSDWMLVGVNTLFDF